MGSVRAFVAIELDPGLTQALAETQAQLRAQVELPVRWVNPDSVHLTLKFLGDIEESRVDEVQEAMAEAAASAQPFEIGLAGVGGFPSLARPRVLWIGVTGEVERLAALQRGLEAALVRRGFPAEDRPFAPHLTLGRVREGAGRGPSKPFQAVFPGAQTGARQRVEAIHLMQSTLRPQGAVYTRLGTAALGGLPAN